MANYQTRTKRIEPGRYQLSYGRGNRKLTCTIWYNDLAEGWAVGEGSGAAVVVPKDGKAFARKKDLVAAWGEWAEKTYGSDEQNAERSQTDSGQPSESGPTPPARKGPPKHKPSLKQKGPPKREKPPNPDTSEAINNIEGGVGQAMLAMLDWAWRNRKDLNHKPWDDAMRALYRIDPDLHAKYKIGSNK